MQRFLSRLSLTLALCLASGAIAVIGAGFLLAAFYLAIQNISSPTIAALASGALALFIALLIALILRIGIGRKTASINRDETARKRTTEAELAAELGGILGAEMTSRIRTHPKGATAVALIAGFIVGASPQLRDVLRDVFKRSD